MEHVELDDVQGIIIRGYGKFDISRFVLLRVTDAPAARNWIGGLAQNINSSAPDGDYDARETPDPVFHLSFTIDGLRALGLKETNLRGFDSNFREGMVTPHRQRVLGDLDQSDPQHWRWGGPNNEALHVMLSLYATDEPAMEAFHQSHARRFADAGVKEIGRLDGLTLEGRREHFGFRDGIGQPIVKGCGATAPAENFIAPGEFILGYRNQYDIYPDSPALVEPQGDVSLLQPDPSGTGRPDFGRNGSYFVFRQLSQDVQGFWQFLDEKTRDADGASDPDARIKLASKMVGRWPSGAPLARHPDTDPGGLSDEDSFGYRPKDEHGERAPIGSHIRRTNPRDGLLDSKAKQSTKITNHHRIIRRSRAYGRSAGTTMHPDDLLAAAPPDHEVGMHFMCFNANISNQFQFIQSNWANSPKFERFYNDPDPLIGARCPYAQGQTQTFTVPGDPARTAVTDLKRFVEVRGGAYLFMPGIRALQFLASIQDNPTPRPNPPSGFLAPYDALATGGLPPADAAKAQLELLGGWLATRPAALFSELRQARPVFVPALGPVLVTRFRDAVEALGLDGVLTVKPAADAVKVIVGDNPFILGMDDSAARDRELAVLRLAIRRTDAERIRGIVATQARAITDASARQGTLDLVEQYISMVPLRLAGEYFGIPGPDVRTLGKWLRAMFRATFRNPGRDPQVDQEAAQAAAEYRAYVATLVAQAHAQPTGRDTVIDRLVAMQAAPDSSFDDAQIMHNASSMLMGMIDTTSAAVAFAVDSLLDRPAVLPGAIAAAHADHNDLLLRYIFEALRFNAPVPLLARFTAAEVVLARGTARETKIPANRLVYVATGSAMMDDTELDNPDEFRLDRPAHQYLHLGWGMHGCFGRHIAQVLLVEMVKNLLALRNLRRAPGAAGHLAFDGPFLQSFHVAYDALPASSC